MLGEQALARPELYTEEELGRRDREWHRRQAPAPVAASGGAQATSLPLPEAAGPEAAHEGWHHPAGSTI